MQMPHSVGVSQGPATMIHAGRITDCTCHQVNGDQYAGTVSYEVPKLYRGKFDYVAKRNGGKWQITRTVHVGLQGPFGPRRRRKMEREVTAPTPGNKWGPGTLWVPWKLNRLFSYGL